MHKSLLIILSFITVLTLSLFTESNTENIGVKKIIVKKGETLSVIAKTHLSNPSRWRELLKYNNIPNPNLIRPGRELLIPAHLGKEPIASADFIKGNVDYKEGEGSQEWNSLKQKQGLFPLDTVRTLSNAKVDLNVQGTGLIRVHENTLVQINALKSEKDPPSIFLRKGSIDAFVSKLIKTSSHKQIEKLRIITPSSIAGVRGTEFRIDLDPKENSTISCFEGLVEVSAENKTVDVPQGYATFVEKGKAPLEPFKIPDPPKITKE
jgi:hypothetical protein